MEIDSESLALRPYPLALLTLMDIQYVEAGVGDDIDDNAPLGMAMCVNTQQTTYHQPAHKFLKALIEHAPSPETVALALLEKFAMCQNGAVKSLGDAVSTLCDPFYVKHYAQVDNLIGESPDRSTSPDVWAKKMNDELNENRRELGREGISSVTEFAIYHLNHLVIACKAQCNICWP